MVIIHVFCPLVYFLRKTNPIVTSILLILNTPNQNHGLIGYLHIFIHIQYIFHIFWGP